jgi:hypothetical protein
MNSDNEKQKDELMAYFMGQTNERLMAIEQKLIELISFRAEILSKAKEDSNSVSMRNSVITGVVLLLIGVVAKKLGF